jgi:pyrroline-5-carboxylate reductase
MQSIGFIGMGFMGGALARAIHSSHSGISFHIIEKDPERRSTALHDLNAVDHSDDISGLLREVDAVFLAVKPQDLSLVAPTMQAHLDNTLVISMLAGTSLERLGTSLNTQRLIRIMPNLGAQVGQAVIGITIGTGVTPKASSQVQELLSAAGAVVPLPEHQMAAITGLAGSGIAYAFRFVHSLAMGAVQEGMPYSTALSAAIDMVISAGTVLRETGVAPEEMVSRVCSPGGTTIAGVRALEDGGFSATVMEAVHRAAERSRELES